MRIVEYIAVLPGIEWVYDIARRVRATNWRRSFKSSVYVPGAFLTLNLSEKSNNGSHEIGFV